jgi:hypothetical protein
MFDRGFSINIEQDQIDKYGIQIYDSTGTLINIPTHELKLDSITGIDSFKRLMETWIVPELKSRFGDNAFLQALTQTADKTKSGVKTYLKLPIPMMDIDKSVELETRYNQYLIAFDEISTQTFAGMKVADLFYLYNLIVNKDSFGQKSLTRIFENLVNSNKGSFLVNDYNQWVSELDASGDFSQLQMNLHDLKGRIAQYVPNTKIEGSLNGVSTPDSCFEVPNLAKSPIRIGSFAKPNSKANLDVPAILLFKNIFGNSSINGIGKDFDVSENTFFLVDMDYDTIDAETFPDFTQEDAE